MKDQKKRICLFAGFDKNGKIADYVVYYLKALAKIADVYYWGDFEALDTEKAKIDPYCKAIYCKKHGKYDFGSWQELIKEIGRKNIEAYDEVILANDSCYGPLFDLTEVFDEMDTRDCDFWGLSTACLWHIHLQSYFIVLKSPVVYSDTFYDFFESVKPEASYREVCANYEDRFTYLLAKAGFSFDSYIKYGDKSNHPYQDAMAAILNRHFPLLKVKFFIGDIRDQSSVSDWRQVIEEHTNYPVRLIEEDLERRGLNLDEVDHKLQSKKSETPNFYSKDTAAIRTTKRAAKTLLRPALSLAEIYMKRVNEQFFFKMARMNRAYRQLRQEYDELRAQNNPDYAAKELVLREGESSCALALDDVDAVAMRRFDLEMPLANEANALIIGDIDIYNLASLELYEPEVTYLNNHWAKEVKVVNTEATHLCDFHFEDAKQRQIYFDFILAQPFKNATSDEVETFVKNIKRQMIFESVLIMLVADKNVAQYEEILGRTGLQPANAERGLVVRGDPFQTYCDKIKGIKGYKALIYKLK